MLRSFAVLVAALALIAAACGGQPDTCDEAADETIELTQDLIDDVEREFEEMSVEDFIAFMASGEDLPSVVAFEERAAALSARLGELGCTQEQLEAAVAARTDRLHATNEIGQFLIDAIERGGL